MLLLNRTNARTVLFLLFLSLATRQFRLAVCYDFGDDEDEENRDPIVDEHHLLDYSAVKEWRKDGRSVKFFDFQGYDIVLPKMELKVQHEEVQRHSNGQFSFKLQLNFHSVKLPNDFDHAWTSLNIKKVTAKLRASKCGAFCDSLRVKISKKHLLTFNCGSRSQCEQLLDSLRHGEQPGNKVLTSIRFVFLGFADGMDFGFWSTGLAIRGPAKGFEKIGCFKDTSSRDLAHYAGKLRGMTVEMCGKKCRKAKFPYFGVQHKQYCFCGYHYNRFGRRNQNECRTTCVGNSKQYCGGIWRNEIYKTGIPGRGPYQRIGCYADTQSRDLLYYLANKMPHMTINSCGDRCLQSGYPYFGVQHKQHCFCGYHYGRYGRRPDNQCRTTCTGNGGQYCGGIWTNDVYRTGRKVGKSYRRIGCYADRQQRDLPVYMSNRPPRMTVESCGDRCRTRGYKYFGVQHMQHCFCGNSYGRYGRRPDSECRTTCTGNGGQYCGGIWTNDVYHT